MKDSTENIATDQINPPKMFREMSATSSGKMIQKLLAHGLTLKGIADALSVSEDLVKTWTTDKTPIQPDDIDRVRLYFYFLKERIKGLLRRSPYLGFEKGSKLLGIESEVYREVYGTLIESGEISYTKVIPSDWDTSVEKPLRKHTVK